MSNAGLADLTRSPRAPIGEIVSHMYRRYLTGLRWATGWRLLSGVALAVSLPLGAPLSAQIIGRYERDRGRSMLRVVGQNLAEHYYDTTFHGVDLQVATARADSQIQIAKSNAYIFSVIGTSTFA